MQEFQNLLIGLLEGVFEEFSCRPLPCLGRGGVDEMRVEAWKRIFGEGRLEDWRALRVFLWTYLREVGSLRGLTDVDKHFVAHLIQSQGPENKSS